MTTLDAEDFERFVIRSTLSKRMTLEMFKKLINKSHLASKNNLFNPPVLKTPRNQVAKYLKEINLFKITIIRDLHKDDFDEIVDTLTDYKNKGWINFEVPTVTECGTNNVPTHMRTDDSLEKKFSGLYKLSKSTHFQTV